jgi:hypothetical protein
MDIRNDICPPEAQRYLQALIYRTQEAFPTIFPTIDDVVKYVNKIKDAKIAELFLDIGDYYHSAKYYRCPKCFPTKRVETCLHCEGRFEMPAFIVLIMAISVMEKLASVDSSGIGSWVDFYDWVNRKDINKEYTVALRTGKFKDSKAFIDSLKARWSAEFGSLPKLTSFLKAIMSPEEKIELIKSIRHYQKVPDLPAKKIANIESNTIYEDPQSITRIETDHKIIFEKQEDVKAYFKEKGSKTTLEALSICFDYNKFWNCYVIDDFGHGQGYCLFKHDCALLTDTQKLDKCFKETLKTIYDWRGKFIHDVQLPPIRDNANCSTIYKGKNKVSELTTANFKTVFERIIQKFNAPPV